MIRMEIQIKWVGYLFHYSLKSQINKKSVYMSKRTMIVQAHFD